MSHFTGLSLHRRHSKPSVSIRLWFRRCVGRLQLGLYWALFLEERFFTKMLRMIKSKSSKRVFLKKIYMINLRHDFVVYVYLCSVRHNLLFGRSREDFLDLQRGRIQKFLFDKGLRGRWVQLEVTLLGFLINRFSQG